MPGKRHSCIVIGAGLAGLAAAYRLTQRGWHVDIFEAQARLGGRVLSHRFKAAPNLVCELGGEWIGADHDAMKQLCCTFKLPLQDHRYSFSFWNVKKRSRSYQPGEWSFSRKSKEKFDDFACKVKNYSDAKLRQL